MRIRLIGALLCSAALTLVTTTGAFAQNKNNGIGDGKPGVLGVGDRKPGAKKKGEPTMSNGDFERSGTKGVAVGDVNGDGVANRQGSGPPKAVAGSKRTGAADNNNPLPRDRSKIRFEAVGSSIKKN